ncbi:type II toxin-antitoxin system RelE/ParE family toxin [Nostoc sp.]
MIDRITKRSQQLANFPLSGRIVPEFETEQIREVIEGSYRIIYYIKPEQIDVLAVIHGAQEITPSIE